MGNEIFDALRKMVEEEPYSQKLGIELLDLGRGHSLTKMVFSEDLKNIFGMAHGGVIFSLIDEAFEAAANSDGVVSLALNVNVTYIHIPSIGDTLYAEAKEISKTNKIATYRIQVSNDKDELIAICQAMAYRKKDSFV
ncbi:MAG: PaaI family thioesterase [Methanotrichaceae archaeon]